MVPSWLGPTVDHRRAAASFVGLAVLWGLTVTAMEVGLRVVPPLLLSAIRYGLAGVLLLGYVAATDRYWRPCTRADLVAVAGGGACWIAVGNGVWFVGQALTTSVLSGLMTALIPVSTAAVSWAVIPADRLGQASVGGLLLSFLGALLLFWPLEAAGPDASMLGKSLLLVGVAGTAVGSVLIRWAQAELPEAGQTAWSVLLGAGLILGLSAAVGEPWAFAPTAATVGAVAYLVIPGTVVAYLLFFALFTGHSAIEISLVTYLVPVVAGVAGWLAFREPVTLQLVASFAVIVAGFAVMKRRTLADEVAGWLP